MDSPEAGGITAVRVVAAAAAARNGGPVFRAVEAIRWDGTNGAAVAAVCDAIAVDQAAWSVESETWDAETGQGALLLRQAQNPDTWAVWPVYPARPWVVCAHDFGGILARLSDDEYGTLWTEADEVGDLTAVGAARALLENAPWLRAAARKLRASLYGGLGVAGIPALAGGANATIGVDILPAQVDELYDAKGFVTGGAGVLAALEVTAVANATDRRVLVTVTNKSAAGTPAALLLVHVS